LTGELSFAEAKPSQVRDLAMARVDPELFGRSWGFVGDLAETVALIWPEPEMLDRECSTQPQRDRQHFAGRELVRMSERISRRGSTPSTRPAGGHY
jgi:hypothetical protein